MKDHKKEELERRKRINAEADKRKRQDKKIDSRKVHDTKGRNTHGRNF